MPGAAANEELAKNAAVRELAYRELCRRRLLPYIMRLKPDYLAGWFHVDLAARLERFVKRVEAGLSPKMCIEVPPRHGKSEQASKGLVAWFLGRNPSYGVIAATHSDRLAMDNSRDVLRYVRDERSLSVFPDLQLDKDNQGAMGWRTSAGGHYKPVGVGAGIAGYGAHVLIIDDPHRDKDAYSETVRDNIHRWYKSSARTRLAPGGGQLVIQTRWVFDDLVGRLLDEEGSLDQGGEWERIRYPAVATEDEYRLPTGRVINLPAKDAALLRKKGEALHPERYPLEALAQHMSDELTWAALYQQDPTAGSAALFKQDRLRLCKLADVPKNLVYYIAGDLAVSLSDRANESAFVVAGVDVDDVVWIVDVRHEKLDTLQLCELILALDLQYKPDLFGIEKTHSAIAIKPVLDKMIADGELTTAIHDLEHGNKDKTMRARPIQARILQGKVVIPDDAEWSEAVLKQLREFPGGKLDDIVDGIAWIGQMLDLMDKAKTPVGVTEESPYPQSKPWHDQLRQHVTSGRKARTWKGA